MYAAKSGKYCRYNFYAGGCEKINCPFKHINVGASKLVKECENGDKVILKTVNRFSLKRKMFESKEEVRVSINNKYSTWTNDKYSKQTDNNPPEKKMKVEEVSIKTSENERPAKKNKILEKTIHEKEEIKENISSRTKFRSYSFQFDYQEELDYEP